jgi:hypothetical protein
MYHGLCQRLPPPLPPALLLSLSSDEIEGHVRRMIALDRNWTSKEPRPKSQKSFRCCAPGSNESVRKILLLPGGRWLFTFASRTIALWDLNDRSVLEPAKTITKREKSYVYGHYTTVDLKNAPGLVSLLGVGAAE